MQDFDEFFVNWKSLGVSDHARLNSLQFAVRLRNFLLCFGLPVPPQLEMERAFVR